MLVTTVLHCFAVRDLASTFCLNTNLLPLVTWLLMGYLLVLVSSL